MLRALALSVPMLASPLSGCTAQTPKADAHARATQDKWQFPIFFLRKGQVVQEIIGRPAKGNQHALNEIKATMFTP